MNADYHSIYQFNQMAEAQSFFNDLSQLGKSKHERLKLEQKGGAWLVKTQSLPNWFGRVVEWIFGRPKENDLNAIAHVLNQLIQTNQPFFLQQTTDELMQTKGTLHYISRYIANPALAQTIAAFTQQCDLAHIQQLQSKVVAVSQEEVSAKIAHIKQETDLLQEKQLELQEKEEKALDDYRQAKERFILSNQRADQSFQTLLNMPHALDTILRCKDGDVLSHSLFLSHLPYFSAKRQNGQQKLPATRVQSKDGIVRQLWPFSTFSKKVMQIFQEQHLKLNPAPCLNSQEAEELKQLAHTLGVALA